MREGGLGELDARTSSGVVFRCTVNPGMPSRPVFEGDWIVDDNIFHRSWPGFMSLLDTDPQDAMNRFAPQLMEYLRRRPPWPISGLSQNERDDFTQDLYMHFGDKDCARFRSYRDLGIPMVAWISVVATFFAFAWIGKLRKHASLDWDPVGPQRNPGDPFLQEVVVKCLEWIEAKDRRYRLLLEYWADGYKPRDMIVPGGYGPGDNKKVFNHLQQARKWLRQCLKGKGIYEREVL